MRYADLLNDIWTLQHSFVLYLHIVVLHVSLIANILLPLYLPFTLLIFLFVLPPLHPLHPAPLLLQASISCIYSVNSNTMFSTPPLQLCESMRSRLCSFTSKHGRVLVALCNGTQGTRHRSIVPRAINPEPNCSLLFVFKVSILNKHVSCK